MSSLHKYIIFLTDIAFAMSGKFANGRHQNPQLFITVSFIKHTSNNHKNYSYKVYSILTTKWNKFHTFQHRDGLCQSWFCEDLLELFVHIVSRPTIRSWREKRNPDVTTPLSNRFSTEHLYWTYAPLRQESLDVWDFLDVLNHTISIAIFLWNIQRFYIPLYERLDVRDCNVKPFVFPAMGGPGWPTI